MGEKPQPRVAVRASSYALLYNQMIPAAKAKGYALAVHGSMQRDLDLVAVPWVDWAADAQDLAEHLATETGWRLIAEATSAKPHGRTAFTILDDETGLWVDLSVTAKPRAHSNGGEE